VLGIVYALVAMWVGDFAKGGLRFPLKYAPKSRAGGFVLSS